MSIDISPENEQFIQFSVAQGVFPDRGSALNQAVELLRQRQQLLEHIDEGLRQLRDGGFDDFDMDGLRQFFDKVQAEGRARYEAARSQ